MAARIFYNVIEPADRLPGAPYEFGERSIESDRFIGEVRLRYLGLGAEKWMECIDESDRRLGEDVYDRGLHGRTIEPGYMSSMRAVFDYLADNLGAEITSDLYLGVHSLACAHFRNRVAVETYRFTYCEEKHIGRFRGSEDHVVWNAREVSDEAKEEFERLGLGTIEDGVFSYTTFTEEEVRAKLDQFITEYKSSILEAETPLEKLRAIGIFIRKCEWLHAPYDGCGRTDTALLNFLLTQNGFHPVLLDRPFSSSVVRLDDWIMDLQRGLLNWELQKEKVDDRLRSYIPVVAAFEDGAAFYHLRD